MRAGERHRKEDSDTSDRMPFEEAIPICDERLTFFSTKFYELTTTYRREIARLRERRNALLPIYSLPPEILLEIFRFVLEETKPTLHYNRRRALCLTARAWWALIRSTSAFWSIIDLSQTTYALRQSLQLCRSSPLSIFYDSRSSSDPDRSSSFFDSARKMIKQWQYVEFDIDPEVPSVGDNFRSPAPLLDTFILSCNIDDGIYSLEQNLFDGQTDNLKRFIVCGITFRVRSSELYELIN